MWVFFYFARKKYCAWRFELCTDFERKFFLRNVGYKKDRKITTLFFLTLKKNYFSTPTAPLKEKKS